MTDTIPQSVADEAEPAVPFDVEVFPDRIDPGSEVVLTALVQAEHADGLDDSFVVFLDEDGNELGRGGLTEGFSGTRRSEPVELIAPDRPGPHRWSAVLARPVADDGEVLGAVAFDVMVAAHPIALTLWDVPPAVERRGTFSVRLGIKCPCGCDSSGWAWRIADDAGAEVAAGTVGDAVWPGTTGLHYAEVELTAPDSLGVRRWTVSAVPPEHEIPHAGRTLPLRIDVRAAADATLTVEAIDAASGRPVERAKVTAHPFRTLTDADGRAVLRLPPGAYTVFVSGKGYFAAKRSVDLTSELTIRAELQIDRELTHADSWG